MLSSARSFSKQVLSHRQQIQQQTKTQLRNQQHGQHNGATRPKEQLHDDDAQHTGAMLEKMRQENRERKKRWREVNGERNKDNDLRCRVNKRANQLYGMQSSEAKARWIVEEFERRQQRRRDKETRKRSPLQDDAAEQVKAKCARKEGVDDAAVAAGRQAIPLGFGSYAAMPAHQIRAAQEFWKCAAGHHALETSAGVGERALVPGLAKAVAGHEEVQLLVAPETSHRPPAASTATVLPPLSSVVPEEYLSHPVNNAAKMPPALANAHAPASMHRGNPSSSAHVPPLSQQQRQRQQLLQSENAPLLPGAESLLPIPDRERYHCEQQQQQQQPYHHHHQQRHVRPWEDQDPDDALCWSPAPGSVAYPHISSPLQPSNSDLAGLSEAAFSLMSLSSSVSASDCSVSPTSYQSPPH
ncbi:hypothetical protein LPJ75_006249 [Coemansia sp. RSA 2598]|nr:hypothetical protein LPJ75_006249 [Coemansia sp. RSA 2598]